MYKTEQIPICDLCLLKCLLTKFRFILFLKIQIFLLLISDLQTLDDNIFIILIFNVIT